MLIRRSLFALVLASTPACVDVVDDDLTLDEIESDLSAANWAPSTNYYLGDSLYPTQVATLNGTTYLVTTGQLTKDMYWRKRNPDLSWTAPRLIPGQKTKDRASLAAFNGYLYMMHVGESEGGAVWFSRFDPATETWMPNVLLSFTTEGGPPALAAFDNRLFIVGIESADNGTFPVWVATMNTSEVFSYPLIIPRQFSASRPSLAVFGNKLYMAHRHGETGEIVYSTHGAGAPDRSWTNPAFINAGPAGAAIRGNDPSIAAVNGYLHLVHRRFDSELTQWTYFNGCTWAPELAIDTFESDQPLSLTASSEGLVLSRGSYWATTAQSHATMIKRYLAPIAPETVPQCQGNL